MPSSYSVSDLLTIFKDVYQHVDMRWVVAREKERWLLVAMSAHVRFEDSELKTEDFRYQLGLIPGIEWSAVRVFQRSFPIEDLDKLVKMISAGHMVLDDIEFTLSAPRDVMTQIAVIQPPQGDVPTKKWPKLQYETRLSNDNSATQIFLNDSKLSRATELAGYRTPEAAISRLLEVQFTSNSIGGFWITMDVPLRMLAPTITRTNNAQTLIVYIETHPLVIDVACAVRVTELDRELRSAPVALLSRVSGDLDIASWQAEIPLELQRGELLEVDVLCNKAGRLYSTRKWAEELLPVRITNPLFAALTMFCSPTEVRSLLMEPETVEPPSMRKKPDHRASLFEISVQWLLSVLGFQAVWLHGYEICKKGKVEIGAVDCLAYSERERLLLLVNCSLGAPDPAELNKHEAFCATVSDVFSEDANVKVLSVVVTATLGSGHQQANSSVVILYKDDLEKLRIAAESGRLVNFANYTNPIVRGRFID